MSGGKGFTVWFTGLPCSGKTTLSALVAGALRERGLRVELLDGDEVRKNLSKGLGFSKSDRDANIRRIGYVCRLLSRNEVAAVAAFVSPYRAIRDELRSSMDNFFEVYVKCPVEECRKRDMKGMYRKADAGEIKEFTGVSAPYEAPEKPEVVVETDKEPPEACAKKILAALEAKGLAPAGSPGYDSEEEARVAKRLENLGYL